MEWKDNFTKNNIYFETSQGILYNGNSKDILKSLPDNCIDTVITSPPYWLLRDYEIERQIGLESTFMEYINNLCDIFDEVKRILKANGTLFINIGDKYLGSTITNENIENKKGKIFKNSKQSFTLTKRKWKYCHNCGTRFQALSNQYFCSPKCSGVDNTPRKYKGLLQNTCLLQIPNRFAIEMCNRGWILRNEIIWKKDNAMPQSVENRFTVDFEKIFFFVKNKKYYFNQQFEECKLESIKRIDRGVNINKWTLGAGGQTPHGFSQPRLNKKKQILNKEYNNDKPDWVKQGRNKRCVWTINTKTFKEAHFATFPPKIPENCIKAGCSKNGIVLDPFMGSGTTALVSEKLNRKWVGIELNKKYCRMIKKRINEYNKQIKFF